MAAILPFIPFIGDGRISPSLEVLATVNRLIFINYHARPQWALYFEGRKGFKFHEDAFDTFYIYNINKYFT
jgi:hypothetical protein